jgi:oxalate decarboxylase/phosphoglucose isomerase-like protein (cupin superfamily)
VQSDVSESHCQSADSEVAAETLNTSTAAAVDTENHNSDTSEAAAEVLESAAAGSVDSAHTGTVAYAVATAEPDAASGEYEDTTGAETHNKNAAASSLHSENHNDSYYLYEGPAEVLYDSAHTGSDEPDADSDESDRGAETHNKRATP